MDTPKTCPACQKENETGVSVCKYCGVPLLGLLPARTTEPVPDIPLKIKPPDHIIHLTRLYSDMVVVVVLGQEQPILLKGGGKTVLGRYSPGDVAPSVDLTPYNANLLGVSRQHATISMVDNNYVLEDIGSTNGTWLNEVKLLPNKPTTLHSGDLVRLGQLGLYVYFDQNGTSQKPQSELILRKENLEDRLFTLDDLTTRLLPYLNALLATQKVFDSVPGRETREIELSAISFDAETSQIKVKFSGADDAFRLLRSKILPWKLKHVLQTTETKTSPVTDQSQTAQSAPSQSQVNGKHPGLEDTELQLVGDLVDELAPNQSPAEKAELAAKLTPHVHTLVSNPLQFVAND